ncbi:hypothetical protein CR513_04542, partial [Mucuna pruriens]
MDIAEIYNWKELELKDIGCVKFFKPKAAYVLIKPQRVTICTWVKEIKLPNGYASNLSRCADLNQGKLHGTKSHDCHVFMQRLLLIAFDLLPKYIWKPLVEHSHFLRELTLTILNIEKLTIMEGNIFVLLCKLEQIFPPSFFDSMKHLPVHLPYEARVGGLVQYRWMYLFESLLVEETSTFASFFYLDKIETRRTRMPRNVDLGEGSSSTLLISNFNYSGRATSKSITYFLDQVDLEAAQLYVLLNCQKVQPYSKELNPTSLDAEIDYYILSKFPVWFKQYVLNSANNIQDSLLVPKRKIESWPIYIINEYKFHAILWSVCMNSLNHDIYVRGTNEYTSYPIMKLVFFKCDWFDNTPNIGTKVHNKYQIIELRESRRYNKAYDPFIFAQQDKQIYYTLYPKGH